MNPTIRVVQPSGVLDSTQATQLQNHVDDVVNAGANVVLVDLQAVTFMDSSGLAALVVAFKTVRSAGGDLCVCSLNQQVRMLFELTSMDRIFQIFRDREEFVQARQKK
jgi:anti-anti-sigma factor